MSLPSNKQGAPRPARRYRGSARRIRQISWKRNTPLDLVILFLLTMIVVFALLSWVGQHFH
jgi:hypothetical protein